VRCAKTLIKRGAIFIWAETGVRKSYRQAIQFRDDQSVTVKVSLRENRELEHWCRHRL
jgi:hypothetical protein